jgi:uncharacterized protein YndB with AHSA1/START domain
MVATIESPEVQPLEIRVEELIAAPPEIVFEAILEQLGPHNATGPESPLPMVIEPWVGGRWYRDLGNNAGHFWGHVQVFKPPLLLEICGPLCMSYPAYNHVQYRVTVEGDRSRLTLLHRAFGPIIPEHLNGMPGGWAHELSTVRKLAERRAGAKESS